LDRRVAAADDMLTAGDSVTGLSEPDANKTAVWIVGDAGQTGMGKALLQHFGYDVEQRSAAGSDLDVPPEAVVFLALPDDERAEAARLASALARAGHRKLVLVSDSHDGGPARRRHGHNGVLVIPRRFTAFDLQWVEKRLSAGTIGGEGPDAARPRSGGRPDGSQGSAG
jgi:hypothetical protein